MFLALVALLITAGGTPPPACSGVPVVAVPLASRENFRSEAPGGLVILGVRNANGWDLSVFAAAAPQPAPNLIAQSGAAGATHLLDLSALSSLEHPGDWLIPVRSTPHTLCIRFQNARIKGSGSKAVFAAGTLEIRILTAAAV
jgi:hypothetical protein